MDYSIKPIETMYHGVEFRSRLEARWGAMFDLLGWKWDYEPVDFDGWAPDFAIYGAKQTTYVEVKPVTTFPQDVADKIDASSCLDEALIVGQVPTVPCKYLIDSISIGWLRQMFLADGLTKSCWSGGALGRWAAGEGVIGFCHDYQLFEDRISGGYDGGRYGSGGEVTEEEMLALWREAGNLVKWRPRHSRSCRG